MSPQRSYTDHDLMLLPLMLITPRKALVLQGHYLGGRFAAFIFPNADALLHSVFPVQAAFSLHPRLQHIPQASRLHLSRGGMAQTPQSGSCCLPSLLLLRPSDSRYVRLYRHSFLSHHKGSQGVLPRQPSGKESPLVRAGYRRFCAFRQIILPAVLRLPLSTASHLR